MTLGPFVISLPRLFLLLGILAGFVVAWRIQKKSDVKLEPLLWLALLAGLVVARLVYVLQHAEFFGANPLDVLKVWQGGFEPVSGALAALLTANLLAQRRRIALWKTGVPVLVGAAVWGAASWTAFSLQRAVERPLPALALQTLEGGPAMLSDFRGEPLVINVWATWCPPCRREMPMLAEAARQAEGVQFVFLNQGEGRDAVRAYLRAEELEPPNVLLDVFSRSAQALGTRGLPTTLFFDAEGQLVDTHVGELSAPGLADYLQRFETAE